LIVEAPPPLARQTTERFDRTRTDGDGGRELALKQLQVGEMRESSRGRTGVRTEAS
jgi:hypothetical protein